MKIKVNNRNLQIALSILNQRIRANFLNVEWNWGRRRKPRRELNLAKWRAYKEIKAYQNRLG